MKSSRWLIAAVVLVGLLAGAAIVGRPTSVPGDVPLPLDAGTTSTTSTTVAVAPTTTAPVAATTTTTTPDETPDTSAGLLNTTTTTVPDPADVRVVVGNGTTLDGVATRIADELIEAGYVDVVPTNALTDSPESYVVYRDGFEAAAIAVAEVLGIDVEQVLPYIDTDVTESDEDGDVIVVVGADRAE